MINKEETTMMIGIEFMGCKRVGIEFMGQVFA